jgi:hypothetical protein
MNDQEPTINFEDFEQSYSKPRGETGVKMEIISGVQVFTIETEKRDESISKIAQSFGENTVFRIINAHFVNYAIEFGTDKGCVDEHDFRRVVSGAGYDVWDVEKQAIKEGLKKSDVFCGTPYGIFIKGGREFSSDGLGIPDDRCAILIYDAAKLRRVYNPEKMGNITDGYAFKDIKNKKEALLGIVKFKEILIEFERELQKLESVDEKIALIEKEVFQNLNTLNDLEKAPYLALNILLLLHSESLENVKNPSNISAERISKLRNISNSLKYEMKMIELLDNMANQINITREAFVTNNEGKKGITQSWPDFVIETTEDYLQELKMSQKYRDAFTRIVDDAKKCKKEFGIGKPENPNRLEG